MDKEITNTQQKLRDKIEHEIRQEIEAEYKLKYEQERQKLEKEIKKKYQQDYAIKQVETKSQVLQHENFILQELLQPSCAQGVPALGNKMAKPQKDPGTSQQVHNPAAFMGAELQHSNFSYFHRQQKISNLEQYDRRIGTADMTGELFEVNVASLLFIRGMFETDSFYLATNIDQAGAFDDLVFKFTDKWIKQEYTCFLQLKTKVTSTVIRRQALCATSGEFSLLKYYDSYCDIKKKFSVQNNSVMFGGFFGNCEFIIYTNIRLEFEDNWCEISSNNSPENLLYSSVNQGKIFCLKLGSEEDNTCFNFLKSYVNILQEISTGNFTVDEIKDKLEEFKQLSQCKKVLDNLKKGRDFMALINDQCSELGDRTIWEQFLKKLKMYTCQTFETELEASVKNSIETFCGISGSRTEEMFIKMKEAMTSWWRKGNVYLTQIYTPFWNEIMENHITDLVASFHNKMSGISQLRFRDTQDLSYRYRGQVTHIITQVTKLSCLKVEQALAEEGHIMIESNTLQVHLSEILALWRRGLWYNILVVEGGMSCQDVITKICEVLSSCTNKQLIIINCDSDHTYSQFSEKFHYETYTDNFSLSQLDDKSQKLILNSKLDFQGSSISLKSLADIGTLTNFVTADIIVELLTSGLKVGQKLPDQDVCYISRILLRREHVDLGILAMKEKDHYLAMSGISLQELQKLVPSGENVINIHNFNQTEYNNDCQYFVISNESDLTGLCNLYKNVHWLDKMGNKFVWKTSKGDRTFIRNRATNELYSNMKEIMDMSDRVVLLIADPGMGKSTELLHLASEMKYLDPTMWVIRVDLNNHTECLSRGESTGFDLLMEAGGFNAFEKVIFEQEINNGGNVLVLLDGFDEVSPIYANKVIHTLRELMKTKIKQFWLTSRPVMKEYLENELFTIHFELKPFSANDQKLFLLNFWKMKTDQCDMDNFINKLLKLTEKALSERFRTFTGIPLQTRMLAEAFHSEAKSYSKTGKINLPHKLDMLQLYDTFVNRKWEIYCGEKSGVDVKKGAVSDVYMALRDTVQEDHINCALVTLLELQEISILTNSEICIDKCNTFLDSFKSGRDKIGIVVDIIDDRAVFVHRTFAEYFVAIWFSKHFETHTNYLREKLFDPNFRIVTNFFDRMLARKFDLHVAVLNQDIVSVQNLLTEQQLNINEVDEGGRTALHLAVLSYIDVNNDTSSSVMQQIIMTLLECGADPNIEDKVLCWRPLCIADQIRAWAAVDLLLKRQADKSDLVLTRQNISDENFVQNVLGMAIKGGFMQLIAFILECGFPVGQGIDITNATMLHAAAEQGQLMLVKFLTEHNININAQNINYKRTPLMCAADRGHLHVVEYLIKKGATLSALDWQNNTALRRATIRGQLEVFKLLSEHDDVLACDNEGNTVLHLAAVSGNTELTTYILDVVPLNINSVNNNHQTALWRAVWFGHLKVTQLLCEYKADLEIQDKERGWTPLHVAVIKRYLQLVKCLIHHGARPIVRDHEGRTSVDLAMQKDETDLAQSLQNIV